MKELAYSHTPCWPRFWSLFLVWSLLVSCNTLQLTYSTADWILLWKLDSYFDLSPSQEKFLDREVKKLHKWHRHDQLPRYTQFLAQINYFWGDGLSQAELKAAFASVENFRVSLAGYASIPGATFLATVTPAQIHHLQKVLDQEHGRLISEMGIEFKTRIKKRIELVLDTLTSWLGDLSVDQETHIRQWIEEVPDTTEMWLAHRKNRQAVLLEVLLSSPDPLILERELYHWLADAKAGATAEYLVISREWREDVENVILKIDRILTPDQRAHCSRKLQRLIQDLQQLEGKGSKIHAGI